MVVVLVAAIQNVFVRFETKKLMIVISYELKQNGQANECKGQWVASSRCECSFKVRLPTAFRGFGSPVKLSSAPTLNLPFLPPIANQVPPSRPGSRSIPFL